MKALKRIFSVLIALVVAAPIVGFLYQNIMTQIDNSNYPPTGSLISVNGAQLHVVCQGEGAPVILFEAGLGSDATWSWKHIAQKLSPNNKACYYDRAGYGWSSESNKVGSVKNLAADLAVVADNVAPNSPLILVGHSFGGPIIRAYAKGHVNRVAGLVFVDSSHEEQVARLPAHADEMGTDWMRLAREYGAPIGLVRLIVRDQLSKNNTINQEDYERLIAQTSQTKLVRAFYSEIDAWITDPISPKFDYDFGETPIFVISQDTAHDVPEEEEVIYAVWAELQQELAGLSSNSEFKMPEGAPHGIPFIMPEEVIEAVKNILDKSAAKTSAL